MPPAVAAADLLQWLRCPLCKGELTSGNAEYFCPPCQRRYPIVLGIPDLRVYSDPYISIEEDHRKGEQVQAQARALGFAELLRFYWENVSLPPTPVDLRERFIRHVLTDEERAEGFLAEIAPGNACLDVGCGAGALLKAARKKIGTVFGCDVAFRWLVIARKRLEEAGLPAHLICCCADHLPFPPQRFDLVTSVSLLEHVREPRAVIKECGRVAKEPGRLFLFTTNRFSLAPEPHVRIWGVGFLPRRWMPAYVKWRRGLSYDKQRLLSCFEVRRMLSEAQFHSKVFSLPRVTPADWANLGCFERLGARLFNSLGRVPLLRWPLLVVSPVIQVLATKRRRASPRGV
jgi:ubiquinone/menaquinone biosynthesis C-methylase UbiE/uncharacterized protein YbaR (Trm112 family)